jgi:HNH endonuclease
MARKWIRCAACGETKKIPDNQTLCSMKCRSLALRQRQAEMPRGKCEVCDKIAVLMYRAHELKVCSQRCRYRAYARLRRKTHPYKWSPVPRGATGDCAYCKTTFTLCRYDQRFCSIKCNNNWHYHFGTKGIALRAKKKAERERAYAEIGTCALCGTKREKLLTMIELGGSKKAVARGIFHRDHIIARSKGGADASSNRRWLCWFCNLTRKDIDHEYDSAIAAAGKAFWKEIDKIPLYLP